MKVDSATYPAISLLLAFLCFVSGCSKEEVKTAPAPVEVVAITVAKQDIPSVMEFVGQTKGAIDAEIRARVDGVITSMNFVEGKPVKEGQLLYTIDPAPLQAKVAEAQGVLAQAETMLTKASNDVGRLRPLAQMKAVSEKQLDAAVAQEGSAKGQVDAAAAALESAKINLSYAQITAPTSGIIGISKAKVGEYVGKAPNAVVLNTVSNLDDIHVNFGVSEKEYLAVARMRRSELDSGKEPEKAKLELILADGSVHPDPGEVAFIDREVDPATGTLRVEAKFPNPHQMIRPGQYAKVRVTLGAKKDALVVPKRALREIQGQFLAFIVLPNNTVEQKTIKVGPTAGDLQVVEEGLSEGDLIVTDGFQRLKPGMTVTVKRS